MEGTTNLCANNREEPLFCAPQSSCPTGVWEYWLLRVQVFQLGIAKSEEDQSCCEGSCEGFEKPFMALLIAIEVSCFQKVLGSHSKLVNKCNGELKRLKCSINYDSKGESSNCGRGKHKGFSVLDEA